MLDDLSEISEFAAPEEAVSQNYVGVKELMKTPKCAQNTTHLEGISELFQSPDFVNLVPTKSNPAGAEEAKEVSYLGLRELVHTPKPAAHISLLGVRELVQTPKMGKSPEVNFEPVLFDDANEEVVVVKKRPGRPKRGHPVVVTVDSDVPEPAEVSEPVQVLAKNSPDKEVFLSRPNFPYNLDISNDGAFSPQIDSYDFFLWIHSCQASSDTFSCCQGSYGSRKRGTCQESKYAWQQEIRGSKSASV